VLKRVLAILGIAFGLAIVIGGAWVLMQARAFDASMAKAYDVPLRSVTRSNDSTVLARGQHLARSLGACVLCHGDDLAGGKEEPLGPLGTMVIPNITTGKDAAGSVYSDAELARLIKHGIRRDGTSVRLMPSTDTAWWPDEDVDALISWIRQQPPVDGNPGFTETSIMGKVLDRMDAIPIDVARRIDHDAIPVAPPPAADAEYGAFVGTSCRSCHGETLAGGPIPGAPPGLAVPSNITPHKSGIAGWTYEDFMTMVRDGKGKDGRTLDPFMPVASLRYMNETETRALWAYLQSVEPRPFGER
jgi:mono/diheme cytochrome c family protein